MCVKGQIWLDIKMNPKTVINAFCFLSSFCCIRTYGEQNFLLSLTSDTDPLWDNSEDDIKCRARA